MIHTYTIEKSYPYDIYSSKAFDFYFGNAKICVLDIETTGLKSSQAQFILGGLLRFTESGALLKQYFAETLAEEEALLAAYLEEASGYDVLITYNGKHFDLPFLRSRASLLNLPLPRFPYNFDLYLVLNGYSALRKRLPNLKQKTIENYMGLWPLRRDEISGGESAILYQEYLVSRKNGADFHPALEAMLLHNSDDVLQLGRLLPVLEKVELHNAMHVLGFPIIGPQVSLTVEKITLEKNNLCVHGQQFASSAPLISYGDYENSVQVRFDDREESFQMNLPLLRKTGLALLDLTKLPVNTCEELKSYPNFGDGYLVLQNQNHINYTDINCFIKVFLKKMIEKSLGGI